MKPVCWRLASWLALLICAFSAAAHESRPAYLEINEIAPGRYSVLWRTPVNAGALLPVRLAFPDGVRNVMPPSLRDLSDSRIERRVIELPAGLAGKRIEFTGLQNTITDVLVRVRLLDGAE